VDTVVFDKTGTLTLGTPNHRGWTLCRKQTLLSPRRLLAGSSHPLARALAQGARERLVLPADLSDVTEVPGYGVEGRWQGPARASGPRIMGGAETAATTAAYLVHGGARPRAFHLYRPPAPRRRRSRGRLQAAGREVWLISGDVPGAVSELAQRLGIANWRAEALPQEKAAQDEALTAQGGAC
jgi:P-type Cu2+ transporter